MADDVQVIIEEEIVVVEIEDPDSGDVQVVEVSGEGDIQIITIGEQGPPGAGFVEKIDRTVIAGISIIVHHVVLVGSNGKAQYASSSNQLHAGRALGVTLNSASADGALTVRRSGAIIDSSFNWIAEQPIYCGLDGVLTQTVPTSGFIQIVGVAETTTSMNVEIETPILL